MVKNALISWFYWSETFKASKVSYKIDLTTQKCLSPNTKYFFFLGITGTLIKGLSWYIQGVTAFTYLRPDLNIAMLFSTTKLVFNARIIVIASKNGTYCGVFGTNKNI